MRFYLLYYRNSRGNCSCKTLCAYGETSSECWFLNNITQYTSVLNLKKRARVYLTIGRSETTGREHANLVMIYYYYNYCFFSQILRALFDGAGPPASDFNCTTRMLRGSYKCVTTQIRTRLLYEEILKKYNADRVDLTGGQSPSIKLCLVSSLYFK